MGRWELGFELGTYDLAPRWVVVFQAVINTLALEQLIFGSAVAVIVHDGMVGEGTPAQRDSALDSITKRNLILTARVRRDAFPGQQSHTVHQMSRVSVRLLMLPV